MNTFIKALFRTSATVASTSWRQFCRLPFLAKLLISGSLAGVILFVGFIGGMGLAVMGTAYSITGALLVAVGAVIGAITTFVVWAGAWLTRFSFKK